MGMFEKTEFEFHRTDKDDSDLRGYETTLLKGLFPGKRTDTKLSDLRTKFYTHIPAIKQQIYNELVVQGYFARSPETTRNWWLWGGIGMIIVASVLFWLARAATVISSAIIAPPIGLGIVGAAAAVASFYMPAKTAKGSQEAARWRAFRQYLHNIEKYTDLAQASDQFEAYIGYAVAFGMQQEWLHRFSKVLTAMPGWYIPTYLGGPWSGGYRRGYTRGGSGRGLGDIQFEGPGGLNDMSRSLTEGLNSMSSGLTRMLNDASSAMTSRPKSSGSGGGGFSGGGGGGGGGSGGGSRGFG
jgi:uncharacterized membrane protein YgcG